MASIIKIGFIGYSDNFETYRKTLAWFDDEISFEGAWFYNDEQPDEYNGKIFSDFDELIAASDAIFFFGEKIRKKVLSDTIKAFKHVFIDDYTALMNADVESYQKLVNEAGTITQVSFPKMYYWGVQDLQEEYTKVRNIYFSHEYPYHMMRQTVDLSSEIMAAIKLINEDVIRAHQTLIPLITKKTESQSIEFEFATGATASILGIPCGFFDRHELRIIAERNLAFIDLRKREWHSLKLAKLRGNSNNLIKGLASLPEVGDIEQFEIEDFIDAINESYEPFITFKDIADLYNCIQLLEDSE
ncbi:MAG: hypothetical protein LBL90_07335 [Prevotellaceae bacterium]|jgi:hypothetical protein|nr:hypothetical protein [Prevotellaceae bacterium]